MYLPNLKSVPGIIGREPKNRVVLGNVLGNAHTPYSPKTKYRVGLAYRLFLYVHSFCRNFRLEFWVRVANLLGRRALYRGSGMVPPERALVTYIGPPLGSIGIFPLSLHVSKIWPLLCYSTLLFTTPTLNFPMFPCMEVRRR